jgi:hypothetical protein
MMPKFTTFAFRESKLSIPGHALYFHLELQTRVFKTALTVILSMHICACVFFISLYDNVIRHNDETSIYKSRLKVYIYCHM